MFEQLKGLTLIKIEGLKPGSHKIIFYTSEGDLYCLWHKQDCCEGVWIEDVVGDVDDLLNSPIVRAEEPSSLDNFNEEAEAEKIGFDEHYTWTFYILGTAKGTVTIRWYGTSNGCYSEDAEFTKITQDNRHLLDW